VSGQGPWAEGRSFLELLTLERTGESSFRAPYVFDEPYPMFGGQVMAQGLLAASRTVPDGRAPHSLHCYFLRAGDATVPTDIEVHVDRDGRRFSSRRLTARQDGKVILTMATSFHTGDDGPVGQCAQMPTVTPPQDAEPWLIPRVFSFEGRLAETDRPEAELRSRWWARCTEDLGADAVLHACAAAYVADIGAGTTAFDTETHRVALSLDNTMWFHRPIDANAWMLVDLVPQVAAAGRGWFTGSVFAADGTLISSIAQETMHLEGIEYFEFGP